MINWKDDPAGFGRACENVAIELRTTLAEATQQYGASVVISALVVAAAYEIVTSAKELNVCPHANALEFFQAVLQMLMGTVPSVGSSHKGEYDA